MGFRARRGTAKARGREGGFLRARRGTAKARRRKGGLNGTWIFGNNADIPLNGSEVVLN
jgi:hypothetical protein